MIFNLRYYFDILMYVDLFLKGLFCLKIFENVDIGFLWKVKVVNLGGI